MASLSEFCGVSRWAGSATGEGVRVAFMLGKKVVVSGFTPGGEISRSAALADEGAVAGADEGDALVERLARTEGAADLVDSRVEGGFGLHACKSVSGFGERIESVREKQMTPIWACL